jgi:hypothetical protein
MFRTFARFVPNGASDLFQFHPSDLTAVLELAWDQRADRTEPGPPNENWNLATPSEGVIFLAFELPGLEVGPLLRPLQRLRPVSLI